MRTIHGIVLIGFLALIGFFAWLSSTAKDPLIYVGLIGLVVIAGLIGFFAVLAKSASGPAQTAYIAAITGLLGSIGGLVGGTAIGNQAGETAAKQVQQEEPAPK